MDTRLASWLERALERVSPILALAILGLLAWMMAAAATAKPFWHDEIYTILIAAQPSLQETLGALGDGTDLQPPLNTLLTRAVRRAVGDGPVAIRVPAMLGFIVMIAAIGWMVRGRTGITLAFAGMLIPVQTAAFRYGYEARGYGLLIGSFAVALCAWSEASRSTRRRLWLPILALALAAGVWSHYHAVFGFVAVAAGELARSVQRRRMDAGVLAALAAAALLCVPLAPFAFAAAEHAPRFWARASDVGLGEVYRFLLMPLLDLLAGPLGAAIVMFVGLAVVRRCTRTRGAGTQEARSESLAPALVATVTAALLPALMHTVSPLAEIPFTPRYGLASVVGTAAGLPLLLRSLTGVRTLAEPSLLILVALPFVASAAATPTISRDAVNPVADRAIMIAALAGPGPLVASGSLTYLQLWYYTPRALRGRLVYVAEPAAAIRITGSDTIDRGYLALARRTPLPIRSYESITAGRRDLLVYAAGSGWLLTQLEEDGATIEELDREPGGRLLRATWPAR